MQGVVVPLALMLFVIVDLIFDSFDLMVVLLYFHFAECKDQRLQTLDLSFLNHFYLVNCKTLIRDFETKLKSC